MTNEEIKILYKEASIVSFATSTQIFAMAKIAKGTIIRRGISSNKSF